MMPRGAVASTSGAPFVEVTGAGIDKAFGVAESTGQGKAKANLARFLQVKLAQQGT